MRCTDAEDNPAVNQRHRTALTLLIAMGIGMSAASIGCQTPGSQAQSQLLPNSQSEAAVRRIIDTGVPRVAQTAKPFATGSQVRPVSYDLPQSGESEQAEESDTLTAPISDSIAPDVTLPGAAGDELPGIVDGGLAESNFDYPIDLMTALRLAGANHLQIALAAERTREANAQLEQARVLWVPSVNVGIGYNRHDGPIQDTSGNVIDVSRQSLYFGGGPAVGGSPLSGGASGPARLFVDLSTADILFEPLAARQNLNATQYASRAVENDSVLKVGLAYQELVRAHLQVGIAEEAIHNAEELVELTESFEEAGKGLVADTQRARAELQQRRYQRAGALEQVAVSSAEVVRLLRLDPSTRLAPVETQPLPIELVETEAPIEALIAQGLTRRPELSQHRARVEETMTRIKQEHWRPWLPHMYLGYAGAEFGGGSNSDLQNFGGRGDFDALAVWQVTNLGLGNRALQNEKQSQHRQAHLQFEWIRDQIIAEVTQAYARTRYRKEQMEYSQQQILVAADALPLNFKGIRDGVIRPIEAQQALAALAAARSLYLASVIDYNQAQLELIRALGEPPSSTVIN